MARSTSGVEGCARALRWGLGKVTSINYSHGPAQNQTSWLVHSWNTFGARKSHKQTQTYKTHHGLNLGEATTFPFIVYFVPLHEAHIQMAVATLRLPRLWGPITVCADLWLKWGLKQSYSSHWELFNGMSHITCTQGNRVDSWLLVVGSQTTNLIPDLFLGHNLCFKCPNGSFEPILNIYVSIAFQWYKELFNPLGFDPYNRSLKIWESTRTPNSQNGSSFGRVRVHSLTLSFTPRLLLGP